MFIDTAKVFIQAGKGGNGNVSFRHEIYVDKGGPDGGDGGKGGDVVFVASKDVNTLLDFRFKPELKAKPGSNGAKQNKRGRSGEDLVVKVPMGTVIKRDGRVIADLVDDGQRQIIAQGGDGGFGNAHFKSSTRQAPKIAELGEDGDTFEGELELKLLADVGLLGFPNAGKSTFLSVVSNARPEIADYEFTTLTPNLGVADIDDGSLLIADIPGLIEGASDGKGLGDDFLRHVERTAVLLHIIDAYSNDVAKSYQIIRSELAKHSEELSHRPEIIALSKCDGLDEDIIAMQKEQLQSVAPDASIVAISSKAKSGIKEVLRELKRIVEQSRAAAADNVEDDSSIPTITLSTDAKEQSWAVTTEDGPEGTTRYVVSGHKIEKFARRTNFEQYQNVNRLRDIMKKMGITYELSRAGATGVSIIRIGSSEFTLLEQS
jgi:GTPase